MWGTRPAHGDRGDHRHRGDSSRRRLTTPHPVGRPTSLDRVRHAHTVKQVRDAEEALLARLPEGALMQRAAHGLANAVLDLLGSAYGRRVLLLVGAGNNGGDALYAGAVLARRGVQVEAWLLSDAAHEAGLAALRAAGGRVVCLAPGQGSVSGTRPHSAGATTSSTPQPHHRQPHHRQPPTDQPPHQPHPRPRHRRHRRHRRARRVASRGRGGARKGRRRPGGGGRHAVGRRRRHR